MARHERVFANRPPAEQRWLTENTWCSSCGKADLGLIAPVEYEDGGKVFLEGKCKRCGERVVSTINDREAT